MFLKYWLFKNFEIEVFLYYTQNIPCKHNKHEIVQPLPSTVSSTQHVPLA